MSLPSSRSVHSSKAHVPPGEAGDGAALGSDNEEHARAHVGRDEKPLFQMGIGTNIASAARGVTARAAPERPRSPDAEDTVLQALGEEAQLQSTNTERFGLNF